MNTIYAILNLAGGVCITALIPHYYPDGPWWVRVGLITLATGCFYVGVRSIK